MNTKNQDPPIGALFWCFVWGVVWLALFHGGSALVSDAPNTINPLTWQGLAAGIYVGLFEMGITFVLWLSAMRLATRTAQISTLIFLSPFISLVLIYVVLGEVIQVTTFMGLSLICIGLYQQRKA